MKVADLLQVLETQIEIPLEKRDVELNVYLLPMYQSEVYV